MKNTSHTFQVMTINENTILYFSLFTFHLIKLITIMNIKKYTKNPLIALLSIILPLGGAGGFTSCSDMLDTKSDMIEFAEDNKLNSTTDTLFSSCRRR